MKVKIDYDLCMGDRNCNKVCPEVFEYDEDKMQSRVLVDEVPKNFDFPEMPLGKMLKESASKWPNNNAIWFLDKFMTYRELELYMEGQEDYRLLESA